MIKKILLVLIVAFVIIQFFRPAKNKAAANATNDITAIHNIPANVQDILQTSCYDCHSNSTQYPWYAEVQPVAWWLDHHVTEGKHELNFSEYATYSLRRQYHKLEELEEQVKEGEMPLSSYTLIHGDAKLSKEQKDILLNWSESARKSMEAKYPLDSLIKKK